MKKNINCFYLFADKHCVTVFKERTKNNINYEYCEIHEKISKSLKSLDFGFGDGQVDRLVFHSYQANVFFNLIKKASYVRVVKPSINYGSDRSKECGIEVGELIIFIKSIGEIRFQLFNNFCGGDVTVQSGDYGEKFEDVKGKSFWGDTQIAKVHETKEKLAA